MPSLKSPHIASVHNFFILTNAADHDALGESEARRRNPSRLDPSSGRTQKNILARTMASPLLNFEFASDARAAPEKIPRLPAMNFLTLCPTFPFRCVSTVRLCQLRVAPFAVASPSRHGGSIPVVHQKVISASNPAPEQTTLIQAQQG